MYRYTINTLIVSDFSSPAHEAGAGDIVITMSGHASYVLFPDDISKTVSWIFSYCIPVRTSH